MKHQLNKISTLNITIAFLFIAFFIVEFVFICTDAEYKMNQQMARGFISSEAVFWTFDNPALKYIRQDEHETESGFTSSTEFIECENPDFILTNKVDSNGISAIEKLLSCSDHNYFAALHNGTLRGVYYKGNITLPPLTSGRFISEEECLSDKHLAVVGSEFEKEIRTEDGIKYIEFNGNKYEVVGITGLTSKSALDSLLFVNFGSLDPEAQLDGIYYIDCSNDNSKIYSELESQSNELFGCGLKTRRTPQAFIDIASGGMSMKEYLSVVLIGLMAFTYINTLINYIRRQRLKISVMKLTGINITKMIITTASPYVISCVTGLLLGMIMLAVICSAGAFALPFSFIVNVIMGLSLAAVFFISAGLIVYSLTVVKISPSEVIRKV